MRGLRPECNERRNCITMVYSARRWTKQVFTKKSEVVGWQSVVSDVLVQSVDQKKNCEKRPFTISQLSCECSQTSRALLYDIITVRSGYHKFCAPWVLTIFTGAHKTQRMASAFYYFTAMLQRWRWLSQSYWTSNRWWKLDFICEWLN
jgi:hypothetical protein